MSNILRKYYNKGKSDLYEGNKKGNSSSQISTFEDNSLYEKQNVPRYALPFKNNHQIENKMYQKINKRLKKKQYEKDQKKLEEFSKLILLDDIILSEDIVKEKLENNIKNKSNNNVYKEFSSINKDKLFNRPLSSTQRGGEINNIKKTKNIKNNLKRALIQKLFKHHKNNNFRAAVSKKSSNENSKIEFTTSAINNKHEYYYNNNNDKVTLIYFNDIIEMKPQNINEMKPIIKNDGIIMPANHFNRGKPQLLNYHFKLKHNKNFRRIKSNKTKK